MKSSSALFWASLRGARGPQLGVPRYAASRALLASRYTQAGRARGMHTGQVSPPSPSRISAHIARPSSWLYIREMALTTTKKILKVAASVSVSVSSKLAASVDSTLLKHVSN